MTTRIIKTQLDRKLLLRFLEGKELPFTVNISQGSNRTLPQNRLSHKWYAEIAEQIDGKTAKDIRAYCKLHLGVPILREENEDFRAKYDRIIKPMPYEHKLEMMVEPFDFPVTSLMNVKQKSLYLETVLHHWVEKGFVLTVPEDRKAA